MPADEDERLRRGAADLARGLEDPVVLERVHAGDADDAAAASGGPRTRTLWPKRRSTIVGSWPRAAERRRDVLEAQRLDAEEGPQAEALVARIGAEQQDVHVGARIVDLYGAWMYRNRGPRRGRLRCRPRPGRARNGSATGSPTAIVYGGLHYGARWLPLPVLNAINLVGNSLAVTFLRRTQAGHAARTSARRSEASRRRRPTRSRAGSLLRVRPRHDRRLAAAQRGLHAPRSRRSRRTPACSRASRRGGRGFLLVTGHVGNWEMGAVTLRRHDLVPAVVGQPELDPNVQEMRLQLRDAPGRRVDRHRLVDGDGVQGAVAPSTAAAPSRCSSTAPIPRTRSSSPSSAGRRRSCARRRCSRGSAAATILPGFFLRNPRRQLLQRLGRAARGRPVALARRGRASGSCPASPRTSRASSARTRRSGSTSTGSGDDTCEAEAPRSPALTLELASR